MVTSPFYHRMALAFLAVAVAGFIPTYWMPMLKGTLSVKPVVHMHAVFVYGWLALFVYQTRLAMTNRIARHREWGVAGVALVTGLCFVATGVAVNSMKLADAAGFSAAGRAFSIVPLTGVVLIMGFLAAALLNVRKPETHKRLLLVITAAMLDAPIGRFVMLAMAPPGAVGPPPVAVTIPAGLLADVFIVVAMVRDKRTLGHVHGAYWVGGAIILGNQLLRVPLSATGLWADIAGLVLSLAP